MQASVSPAPLQFKLTVGQPNDRYEQEADRVAQQVMRMPVSGNISGDPQLQREMMEEKDEEKEMVQAKRSSQATQNDGAGEVSQPLANQLNQTSGGNPLPDPIRAFMEPRFGTDFSQVRVHTDRNAVQLNQAFGARAFTQGNHIYYGASSSPENDALTAHELTHVLQQTGDQSPTASATPQTTTAQPAIQRAIELRPPGRGEASAFERRQELIDRLNRQSAAIQYSLDGRSLRYEIIDEAALTNFDRQMRDFIDRAAVVPLRLITGAGLVQGDSGFETLLVDSFVSGYFDLDDMLASDDLSFQMNLIHILVERFSVRNYDRRIGTAISEAEFNRGHQAGIDAETEHLRSVLNDPTIRFNHERTTASGTVVFVFRSREGYSVVHTFRGGSGARGGRRTRGGEVFVLMRDGRRLTIEQFQAERAAAAAVPAVP